MYREHSDRRDDPDRGCWWFGARDPKAEPEGRFDLISPDGTCYLAETPGVAVRERCGRFLAHQRPIPADHLRGRVVSTVRTEEWSKDSGGAIADLTSPDAARIGVTAELAAGNDYGLTVAWADALADAGFHGIWYQPRFTPGGEYAAALFSIGWNGAAPHFGVERTSPLLVEARGLGYMVEEPPSESALQLDDTAEPDHG